MAGVIGVLIMGSRLNLVNTGAYVPGDDPRYIDWKVAGRSDRYFIKKFEDETNLRCQLVVGSIAIHAVWLRRFHEADYASTLAATLCSFPT